jgi:predicted CoA-substrate-specific enzyme activase
MMIFAGIDAGSRAIKIALIDGESKDLVASSCFPQGINPGSKAIDTFHDLLAANELSSDDVGGLVATGYGRNMVDIADTTITEITCHAAGINHLIPEARTVIEIGGQDSKLLKLEANGSVLDFAMNDRCAAGTGRFLEMVADKLEVRLEDLGDLAKKSMAPAKISSMCVVFAETEIIGLLSTGTSREDIVAGVQNSIASRIVSMAGRRVEQPIVFTGGVALVPGMREALENVLEHPVTVAKNPQITGALGAALLAHKRFG